MNTSAAEYLGDKWGYADHTYGIDTYRDNLKQMGLEGWEAYHLIWHEPSIDHILDRPTVTIYFKRRI